MITQYFGQDIIKNVIKTSSTVVTLQLGSHFRLGGRGVLLRSNLQVDTSVSGVGGLDNTLQNNKFYYVYVVISSGIEYAIGSIGASLPSGFTSARKIGAFYVDGTGSIVTSFAFGQPGNIDWTEYTPTFNSGFTMGTGGSATQKFSWKKEDNKLTIKGIVKLGTSSASFGTGDHSVSTPAGLVLDTSVGWGITSIGYGRYGTMNIYDDLTSARLYLAEAWEAATSSNFLFRYITDTGTQGLVTATTPIIFAANDEIFYNLSDIPIVGWSKDNLDWTIQG